MSSVREGRRGRAAWALGVACVGALASGGVGCGREAGRGARPVVEAEGVVWTEGDVTFGAERARGALAGGEVVLEEVALSRGGWTVRASRGEGGGAGGVWRLSGGVRGWGNLGQSVVDGGQGDGGLSGEDSGGEVAPRVEVEAERLRLDPRARRATLEGRVRLRRGEVLVASPRVVVTYGPSGEVALAEASGPVEARWRGASLRAPGGARVDFSRGVMELAGRVRVEREGAVLEGRGVTVELSTGAVELAEVRGWWPTGGGGGR